MFQSEATGWLNISEVVPQSGPVERIIETDGEPYNSSSRLYLPIIREYDGTVADIDARGTCMPW
jgi:hypothetical protein